MENIQDKIAGAKNQLPDLPNEPPGLKRQSSANDLKARLDWGEPALTILDVRDRGTYNDGHIMGAMPMPMDVLVDRASASLEYNRDIYVYGESDEQSTQAANDLRQAGFVNVAELKGGLPGWKAINGPTAGISESRVQPGSEATNVVARVQDKADERKRAK